jgi:hypothetical protein
MTVIDRFVRWNLDLDGGDLYGRDERERLRWYEGIATAAQVQWVAIPWTAAVAVWVVGKPAVVPLLAVLAALLVPMTFCTVYLHGRRVDTTPRSWSAKRVLLSLLGGLPYVVFGIGAAYHAFGPGSATWLGAIAGAVIGGVTGLVGKIRKTRERRRADAAEALAGDED